MSDSAYRRKLKAADRWQEAQLRLLAKRSFAELEKLSARTHLDSPSDLAEFKFMVYRSRGDSGGVQIAVQRVFADAEMESRQGPSFEILPSGRIIGGDLVEERGIRETAPWTGTTGLAAALERELPRYLRRELGESNDDPTALKVADLMYIGCFEEDDEPVRYWRIPYGRKQVYAYVVGSGEQASMGWGDRKPPRSKGE